jgi:O-antigen ligase
VRAAYGSPNNLALYLERVIPPAAAAALLARGRMRRVAFALALAVMLLCGLLTRSRGLLLLGLPASLAYLAWRFGSRRYRVALAVGLAVLALVAAVLVGGRLRGLLSGQDEAAGMRLRLWAGTLNMLKEHPVWGVGLDNFLYEYRTRYVLPSAWREPNLSHPHNLVLDFWTRLGLGGLVVMVWLAAGAWRASGRAMGRDPANLALYVGLRAALLGALAHGLVDNSFFLVDLSHVFLLYLALAVNGASMPAQSPVVYDEGPVEALP